MAKVYQRALDDIGKELSRAIRKYPRFKSAHEGVAVIEEEFLEFRKEVFKRPKKRSVAKMRAEAIQGGAMFARFIMDVCDR